jgi:thioredoxin reductase (NADPH)
VRERGDTDEGLPTIGRLREAEEGREAGALELEGLPESPDRGAFPRLTPAQVAVLEPFGERRTVAQGEPLFGVGEPGADFVVVLSGAVAMVDGFGTSNVVKTVHGRGRFLGELGILSGQRSLLTAVAQQDGEVLIVPTARLEAALDRDPALRDLVLRTYLLRRSLLLGLAAGVRIVGPGRSERTQALRALAESRELPYTCIDLDEDEHAAAMLDELGVDADETPVVLTAAGDVLRDPTEAEFLRALGFGSDGD